MKRTIALVLLVTSIGLGILADTAMRAASPGLGMFLLVCALASAFWALQRMTKIELVKGWKWMLGAAVAMGGAFLWRDSDAVTTFAFLAAGGAFVLMTLRGGKPRLDECGVLEYGHAGIASVAHAAVGLPMLAFSDIRWETVTAGGAARRTTEVIRGLAITAPVILVLGALFVGADAVFQNMVYSLVDMDLIERIMEHLFFIGFVAWVIAGFLRGTFIAKVVPFPYAQAKPLSLGITEVGIVLGSSILLFALFIAVQFRYLFGGADLVQVTASLTYAEYARRGFFELTTVVALVLPLLLVLDWVLRKENAAQVRTFRLMAITQVVLLFAVIASAVQRMLLYQQEYGLTESRVYTVAFMGWMAVVLLWYVLTVLAGRRPRFAIGAVGAAFLTILVLLVLNPDGLIARTNIARATEGKPMDARYLSLLSDDAVPALMEGFHMLDPKGKGTIAKNLLQRRERLAANDWLSWNWSSSAASHALAGHEEELRAAATAD